MGEAACNQSRMPARRGQRERDGRACFVYFATVEGFTMIGVVHDVTAQVRNIGTSCPFPVTFNGSIIGAEPVEEALHSVFRQAGLHYHNE